MQTRTHNNKRRTRNRQQPRTKTTTRHIGEVLPFEREALRILARDAMREQARRAEA